MNQKMIWALTLVVAIFIVAAAVIVARKNASVLPAEPVAVVPSDSVGEKPPVVMGSVIKNEPMAPAIEEEPPKEEPKPAIKLNEVILDTSRVAGTLKMASSDIPGASGQTLTRYPLELTCYRKNMSPAIEWEKAPAGVKSYVLVLERRVPDEKAIWSWIFYNIPGGRNNLPGNIKPENEGVDLGYFGQNFYGNKIYTGPCEPRGTFRYVLRLIALDTVLDINGTVDMGTLVPAMSGHIVDIADIQVEHYLRM